MRLLKTLLIVLGAFLSLIGLFLWWIVLSRRNNANWENWDGRIHLKELIIINAPIIAGTVILAIARKIKMKISNG